MYLYYKQKYSNNCRNEQAALVTLLQAPAESVSGCLLAQISPAASAVLNASARWDSSSILGRLYVLQTGAMSGSFLLMSAPAPPPVSASVTAAGAFVLAPSRVIRMKLFGL